MGQSAKTLYAAAELIPLWRLSFFAVKFFSPVVDIIFFARKMMPACISIGTSIKGGGLVPQCAIMTVFRQFYSEEASEVYNDGLLG